MKPTPRFGESFPARPAPEEEGARSAVDALASAFISRAQAVEPP